MLPDARVIEPAVHEQTRPTTRLPQAPRVALFAALRAKLYIVLVGRAHVPKQLVDDAVGAVLREAVGAPAAEIVGRKATRVARGTWHRRADAFGGRDLARGGEKAAERCEVVVDTRWRGTCALVMLRPPHRQGWCSGCQECDTYTWDLCQSPVVNLAERM